MFKIEPIHLYLFGYFCFSTNQHKCKGDGTLECIFDQYQCDGHYNCPTGIDEIDCPSHTTTTTSTATSISTTNVTPTTDSVAYQECKPRFSLHSKTLYSQFFILDNFLDYCNSGLTHEIVLKTGPNNIILPAVLTLLPNNTNISNKTCVIRFSIPSSHWYANYGLILGIDYISIKSNTNKTCDDYLQVHQSDKWCESKNDTIGKSFKGKGYLDILFRAGEDSESKFQLVITPFRGINN